MVYDEEYFVSPSTGSCSHLCHEKKCNPHCQEYNRFGQQMERLQMLKEACRERKFQLLLSAEVPERVVNSATSTLKNDIQEWMMKEGSTSVAEFAQSLAIISEAPRFCDLPGYRS